MPSTTDRSVVTVFLRHRGDILFLRRSEEVESYPKKWGTVTGHVENDAPRESAVTEIKEETGLSVRDVRLEREGPPFPVRDDDRGTRWIVHPFLFDAAARSISPNWETEEVEWASPTVLLRRETVPELWTSYRRVAPSIVSVSDDTTHGSSALSIRALEVLRNRAGVLATTEAADIENARARLATIARRLLQARPSMAALSNRIHRVMHASQPELAPGTVEINAHEGIDRALTVKTEVARTAAERIENARVLTLSRSGTVVQALRHGAPTSLTVATSRPGGEGVEVAEALANEGHDVSLCPDAACASLLADGAIDLVLVGADAVHPSGAVVNKVGTRGIAVAAHHEDVPFYAACATDKVSVEASGSNETTDRQRVYDGPEDLEVQSPRFDVTPSSLVTGGIITERGLLTPADVDDVADQLKGRQTWM